jgi:phosphate transport system protein
LIIFGILLSIYLRSISLANISENSVFTATESYEKGINVETRIFEWSERLRILQEEVSDLAVELIARYQPVASNLRMI